MKRIRKYSLNAKELFCGSSKGLKTIIVTSAAIYIPATVFMMLFNIY